MRFARVGGSPWLRDAAGAVGMLAVGLLLIWAVPEFRIEWFRPEPPTGLDRTIPVLAVACAGMVFRRGLPLLGLAVTAAALLVGPLLQGVTELATLFAFADLLYCSVLYPSRLVSRAVCVVGAALGALLTLLALIASGGHAAVQAVLNLLLLGLPILWAAEVRRHRDLAVVERGRAEQAARMAEMDRQAAVTAERARMARDLHDVVAGQLSAIALQSEAALSRDTPDPDLNARILHAVRDTSVSALSEMRTMIGLLREGEPDADPRTAPARLDQLEPLLDSARSWGLTVRVRDERGASSAPSSPAGIELAAYRIIQEGLTNVAKHAPGAEVTLELRHDGDALVLQLDNDVVAHTAAAPLPGTSGGVGLSGLAERARAVGGHVAAGPNGDGWRLRAVLPREPTAPA